jgi:hypothetical protein
MTCYSIENSNKIRIEYKNHVDGKWYFVGYFDTHEEAQKAYYQAIIDIKSGYSNIYKKLY